MNDDAVLSVAKTRYTTKYYDNHNDLTDAELQAVLEILRLTPSSMNVQPWHFYVFDRATIHTKLLPFVKDFNIQRCAAASHIIVMAAKTTIDQSWLDRIVKKEMSDGRFPDGFDVAQFADFRHQGVEAYFSGPDHGEIWVREQVHIALGFLMFAAPQMGIDTTALGGMKFREFDKAFGLPERGEKAAVAIALGRRDPNDSNLTRPKSRLDAKDVITMM